MCLRVCAKCSDSDLSNGCEKSDLGICSALMYFIVSNDSVSGQQRSSLDFADVKARPSLSAYARRHVFAWQGSFASETSPKWTGILHYFHYVPTLAVLCKFTK